MLFFAIYDYLDGFGVGLKGPHQCFPRLLVNKMEPQNLERIMVVRINDSVNLGADII
jgi:hypothetical protein